MLVKDLQLASISSGYRINRIGNRTLKNGLVGARRLSCKRANHIGARQILDKVRNTEPCLSTTTNNIVED